MSNPRPLIIIGGGDHARVVAEAASSRPGQWQVVAWVAPQRRSQSEPASVVEWIESDETAFPRVRGLHAVLGIGQIGSAPLRRRLVVLYEAAGALWAPIVHATAWVSPTAQVAAGAVLMAGAVVNSGAQIGAHAVINTGGIVEHDVRVGAFAVVSPGVAIGGGSVIGDDAYLGLGSCVRDHLEVGAAATVGMGAVVVRPVRPGACVVGVPAREWMARKNHV